MIHILIDLYISQPYALVSFMYYLATCISQPYALIGFLLYSAMAFMIFLA